MADAVGLHLGAHSLDLVQLGGGFVRPRLVKVGHLALPAPIPDGPEAAPALQPSLLALLQQCRIATPKVHVGMAAETAIIRYFQMPKLPAHDRPAAIRFEAKKYLPFKLEELVSDFRVAILKSDPQIMRVMYYAVKRDVVARYVDVCRAAGLVPVSLETSLTSLMRALRRSRQLDPAKTQIVLAVDRDTASIAIVRHQLVYLARNITAAPAAGEAGPTAGGAGSIYSALLNEAMVSVDYYRRRFLGEPAVANVIVSDEAAAAPWLRDLGETLELPVELAEVGRGLPGGDRVTGNTAIAFGLALRAMDRPGAVNLLAGETAPAGAPMGRLIAAEVGAAAVLLALLYAVSAQPVRRLATQVIPLQHPQTTLGLSAAELTLDRLQALLSERQGRVQLLQRFLENAPPTAAILTELTAGMPETLWLRGVAYDGGTPSLEAAPRRRPALTVAGSAYHADGPKALELVNAYAAALNNRPALERRVGPFAVTSVQRTQIRPSIEVTEFELSNQGVARP